jgi:hypothetical protein
VVVLSVVAELVLASIHPSYDSPWNRWGSAIADTLIALGIVGEVLFGTMDGRYQTELRRRSNNKLAEAVKVAGDANERASIADQKAAEATLELVRYRAPRVLPVNKAAEIATSLRELGTFKFAIGGSTQESVIRDEIASITRLCEYSEWEQVDWSGPNFVTIPRGVKIGVGVAANDVAIGRSSDASDAVQGAAAALAKALSDNGILASVWLIGPATALNHHPDIIQIMIGRKT